MFYLFLKKKDEKQKSDDIGVLVYVCLYFRDAINVHPFEVFCEKIILQQLSLSLLCTKLFLHCYYCVKSCVMF